MELRLTLVSMVPLPIQLHVSFSGHQNESNSHQKRQYGLGPLGGPNNGPPAKKGTNYKNIQYISHCNPLFF